MDKQILKAWNKALIIDEDPDIIRFDKYGMEIEFYCYNDRSSPYGWVIANGEAVNWVAAEINENLPVFGIS